MCSTLEVVRGNVTSCSCEVLKTSLRRFVRIRAENLADVNVPLPGGVRVPGKGEDVAVILGL